MANETEWDLRYLELARLVAGWSKDKAKVGAVLVLNNRVVATGFNGFPTNVLDDERLSLKAIKQIMVVHAEVNALLVAGDRARGATLYVHGKPICSGCAALIIQAGVERIVSPRPEQASNSNEEPQGTKEPGDIDWNHRGLVAKEMFAEAGIKVHHIEAEPTRKVKTTDDGAHVTKLANDEAKSARKSVQKK
ncbi:deaminase [Henriciella sp. AS95]|uniref:deoxycytidylate deaminase n=1 Tax=Henriciella sp. AS95 TaxID=3135782 RepID=UPI00316F5150